MFAFFKYVRVALWAMSMLVAARNFWLQSYSQGWEHVMLVMLALFSFGFSVAMLVKTVRDE